MAEDNGYRVEADLVPAESGPACISTSGPDDVFAFFFVDSAIRAAKLRRLSRFYFHENNNFFIAGNDVDF